MPTHTTPPPHADQTDQTAEPARRASRFDERGIALQTIIIMVVLLAIAGSVAAVLLSRAGEETSNLEETDSAAYGITNETGCNLGGHTWDDGSAPFTATNYTALDDATTAALQRAGIASNDAVDNGGYCKPG